MTGESSLWESFSIQKRVVWALLMREVLTRYGRDNIGFLWIFCEPMLFTVAVATLWTIVGSNHGAAEVPVVGFALTGYSAVLLWRNMPARCILAVQPNHTLMHHRNIKLIDIYTARLLLEMSGATISFFLLALLFASLGWMGLPQDPLEVFFGWGMQAWFGCSLALFVGALSEHDEIVHTLWSPVSYILFPLSGAAFAVDFLPSNFQHFVLFLPMVHGTEIIRQGYFGSDYHAHYNVGYMAACNLVLTILGLTQVRVISRQVVA